jgi:uncharacterized protein with gpF-like domain
MPRPFVSSERRVDLLSELARVISVGEQKIVGSGPFEKKDADKNKDIEKKDLKETKDDKDGKESKDSKEDKDGKEQEQSARATSDQAIRASIGDTNVTNEALRYMEIGQKWGEKPAKLIKRDPPV